MLVTQQINEHRFSSPTAVVQEVTTIQAKNVVGKKSNFMFFILKEGLDGCSFYCPLLGFWKLTNQETVGLWGGVFLKRQEQKWLISDRR